MHYFPFVRLEKMFFPMEGSLEDRGNIFYGQLYRCIKRKLWSGRSRTVKYNKQLLDEVFLISRIIKAEVRVISRSRRLRLITLTETLIILDITKTESNNCFIIH